MTAKTGRHGVIEQCLADGMNNMFGNPGTVEQGFLDALLDYPEMHYVLSLQESIAVMMADGHARATHRPALVQIHSTPGLGNAIGALYQAMRGHAPLVVIGGDAGVSYLNMDAQMAGDLVGMARPVTKWASIVTDSRSLLRTLRRAIKIAATPPMGPVYLCLPMDILDAPLTETVRPTDIPVTRTIPTSADVTAVALALAKAKRPVIYMGDGVAYSGARKELEGVAERLGAEVWGVDSGEVNFDYAHPLYQGQTGHMFGYSSKPILATGDVNLVVGTYLLPEVFPDLGEIFPPEAKVYHIDLNAYEIAKNHRVDLGLVADPKETLRVLGEALDIAMDATQRADAAARFAALREKKEAALVLAKANDALKADASPMDGTRFMKELSERLPADAFVFDEALTTSPALTRYLPPHETGHFFQTRGGSLGVGFPGAIGIQIANPGKTVVAFSGDGGSMYTIQTLWSAVRHKTHVKFVVCNNRSYKLLQQNISAYWREREIPQHEYPLPFDLSNPPLDFAQIAHSMGVKAERVEKPDDCAGAIERMLKEPGPYLIDLMLAGDVRPDEVEIRCGQ